MRIGRVCMRSAVIEYSQAENTLEDLVDSGHGRQKAEISAYQQAPRATYRPHIDWLLISATSEPPADVISGRENVRRMGSGRQINNKMAARRRR